MSAIRTAIIVHGTQGSPLGNWFPWLAREISALGLDVHVPAFPTPEGQSLAEWRQVFKSADTSSPAETLLIGHSIGAPFLMHMAAEATSPYASLIAVCPFAQSLGLPGYDELNASFVETDFDWPRIKAGASHRLCIAGADDPYVPLSVASAAAKGMEAKLITIEKGGHLNAEFGYTTFPALLAEVKKRLEQ